MLEFSFKKHPCLITPNPCLVNQSAVNSYVSAEALIQGQTTLCQQLRNGQPCLNLSQEKPIAQIIKIFFDELPVSSPFFDVRLKAEEITLGIPSKHSNLRYAKIMERLDVQLHCTGHKNGKTPECEIRAIVKKDEEYLAARIYRIYQRKDNSWMEVSESREHVLVKDYNNLVHARKSIKKITSKSYSVLLAIISVIYISIFFMDFIYYFVRNHLKSNAFNYFFGNASAHFNASDAMGNIFPQCNKETVKIMEL